MTEMLEILIYIALARVHIVKGHWDGASSLGPSGQEFKPIWNN